MTYRYDYSDRSSATSWLTEQIAMVAQRLGMDLEDCEHTADLAVIIGDAVNNLDMACHIVPENNLPAGTSTDDAEQAMQRAVGNS